MASAIGPIGISLGRKISSEKRLPSEEDSLYELLEELELEPLLLERG
jgi:hypothetical protein